MRVAIPILAGVLFAGCGSEEPTGGPDRAGNGSASTARGPVVELPEATYVGSATCVPCHAAETEAWRGSHHDLAMQEMAEVDLGAMFAAEGPHPLDADGAPTLTTHEGPQPVAYAFGVSPLMQFLIEGRDGRLQAFDQVYDTRSAEEGGQRWYGLFDDQNLQPGDAFHWTGHQQTWNHQCAECHSTGLQRKYDFPTDSYATCWQEIDVACEACHGPASNHLAWARGEAEGAPRYGLLNPLTDAVEGIWQTSGRTGLPVRTPPRTEDVEVQTCATCHSRRTPLTDGHVPGTSFLDGFRPALLTPGLYHADGQIDGEVYVWGSFTQSRMHQQGVTCKDCHDPHSLELRIPGDGLCIQCHDAHVYQTPAHHFHDRDGEGARCVNCHMTATTYMGVDARRDHSFRVPRPDLAVELGTPDACTKCHEQGAAWSAEKAQAWWGDLGGDADVARALHAAREGHADAPTKLLAILQDDERTAIARATAAEELGRVGGQAAQIALEVACFDESALVRATAARALAFAPPTPPRLQLFQDDARSVRVAVAASLGAPPPQATEDEHVARSFDEYRTSLAANAEHAWAQVEMARLQAGAGDLAGARATLDITLERFPDDVPAWSLAADVLRLEGKDPDALRLLQRAVERLPNSAELRFALGLAYVRVEAYQPAVPELQQAAAARPDDPYFGYVYAVALDGVGRREDAVIVLEAVVANHPADRESLISLVLWHHDAGRLGLAREHGAALQAAFPQDADVGGLLTGLGLAD